MGRDEILKTFTPKMENLLLILHALQNRNPSHYIQKEDIEAVAKYLNTTMAAIYGVVRYYTMFSDKPRGKRIVRLCVSPVCRMKGAQGILEALKEELDVLPGETTEDGAFTLEFTQCLGQCQHSPVMMVDADNYGELTGEKARQTIRDIRGPEIEPGGEE
jgi:NADH:ubiquinone oxidoreductase subunit E